MITGVTILNDIINSLGYNSFWFIGIVAFILGLILYLISLLGNFIQERLRTKKSTKDKKT